MLRLLLSVMVVPTNPDRNAVAVLLVSDQFVLPGYSELLQAAVSVQLKLFVVELVLVPDAICAFAEDWLKRITAATMTAIKAESNPARVQPRSGSVIRLEPRQDWRLGRFWAVVVLVVMVLVFPGGREIGS